MEINNDNNKLVIAGAATAIAEPLLALAHGGVVGVIMGFAVGGAAYLLADDVLGKKVAETEGEKSPSAAPVSMPKVDMEKAKSLGYRILHGKSERGEWPGAAAGEKQGATLNQDDEDDFEHAHLDDESGRFAFSDLLATGWRPSYEQIFLARLDNGTDVFIHTEDIIHVALAGSTRQGKTSIIRLLLAQLCYIGCRCILMDPHYTPYDVERDEDWTPYTPYLRFDPLKCKEYAGIEQILRYTATTVLDGRKKLREQSKPVGVPIVLVLDEYPAVVAERPRVQDYVAKLLREGGKYKIILVVASQDFQVKTVSPQAGGAIRDNYKTVFYVGGDSTTAKVLLDAAVDPAIEAILGSGPVMLRCKWVKRGALGQTPFTDNQSLYFLLGESTYIPDGEPVVDEAPEAYEQAHEEFRMVDGLSFENVPAPPADQPQEKVLMAPVIPERGPKVEDIDMNVAIACWNGGINTVTGIENLFGMSHGEAYKLYKRIKAMKKEPVEEAE